jgi:drug/metabolite transporter (DMT)-like permease
VTSTPAGRPAGVGLSVDRRLAEVAVLGVMVVWAANFIVVKDVLGVMPPVAFTFLRYVVASAALLAFLRWSEGAIRLPRPDGTRIVLLGGLGFGLYQILWTVGLQTTPAGDSALLIAFSPVLTAVIAAAIGVDTLGPRRAVGVVLSFLGVVVVVGGGVGIELSGSPIGFALTLGAALCWAIYTAVAARLLRRHSPLVLTAWATVGGTLVLTPIGLGQLLAPGAIGAEQASDVVPILLAILYSGLLAAAAANVVIFHAVRLVGPTRVVALQTLVPALAVVLAYLILGEPIRPAQVIGGVVIVAGVALTRRPARGRVVRPVAA